MTRQGRRRKPGARQPNGQPARNKAAEEKETMSVAIGARQTVWGLSEADAKRMEAGTVLGRLALDGVLSPGKERHNAELYLAGEFYLRTRLAAQRALECRKMASGGNLERVHGYDGDDGTDPDYVEQCQRAIQKSDDLMAEIQLDGGWHAISAAYMVIIEDMEPPELTWLRRALESVRRYMRINGVS